MLGITEVCSYVPSTKINNRLQAESFGETPEFASDRLGADFLPVKDDIHETSDLAVEAVSRLLKRDAVQLKDIDCLVVCTQTPDECGLPHTSAIVHKKLGLHSEVATFDISLGCSGYVYSLNIVRGFMEASGLRCGLLITADPYSKIIDRDDRNTSMLFGDAATVTLLTDDPVFKLGKALFATDGEGGEHIKNVHGKFVMNGRQVFNFASKVVPLQIKMLADKEGMALDEYDKVVLHQGSLHIVKTLRRRLGLLEGVVPCELKNTGNTVSSSIPLILEGLMSDGLANNILISGFGVGLSWASMSLKRVK